uniref:Uncharacterized protein n=1 Tax=Panagrolaimus sp. ES5 TaxID=591445 RepID=A0AC34G3W8_9BILA
MKDVRLQRYCNPSKDHKRGEHTVLKQNTVTATHPSDRPAANNYDISSYQQDKILIEKQVHAPMQGKENGASGKDVKQGNGRRSAAKTTSYFLEDTVLK